MTLRLFVVALVVAIRASAQESEVAISSLGVTEYLRNPCMIVDTQEVEVDLNNDLGNNREAGLMQERERAFTKIVLAKRHLATLIEAVDNECNMDFSLETLPNIPNPFSHQTRDGYRMMERDLLFLTGHVYFSINDTYEADPRCSYETRRFTDDLMALTGQMENLMCNLRILSNSNEHNHHDLEEVLSLRFRRKASCGGRAVWNCILINRISQSLSLLKQLLEVHRSLSGDNELSVLPPQKKNGPLGSIQKTDGSPPLNTSPLSLFPMSPSTSKDRRSHVKSVHRDHHHCEAMSSFISCMRRRMHSFTGQWDIFQIQSHFQHRGGNHLHSRRDNTLNSLRFCLSDVRPNRDSGRWDDISGQDETADRLLFRD